MAKKKEVVVSNEEIIDANANEVVEVQADAAPEKTRLDYIIDSLNEERENNEVSCIWNGVEIKIKKTLSVFEMKVLFDEIYTRCFSTEDGSYQPEYRDFADRAASIAVYTDLNMPENVVDQYDLVYKTDLYFFVGEHIDQIQFASIMDAVDEKVKESIDSKTKEIEKTVGMVSNLSDMFNTLFDGIDARQVSSVIRAISENGIDEEKIVNAVLNK